MSLINDALKRAKDAQQKSPPPAPGPQLRHMEPVQAPDRKTILLPLAIVVVVFLGVLLFWIGRRSTSPQKSIVAEAKSVAPIEAAPEAKPAAPVVAAPVAVVSNIPTPPSIPPPSIAPAPEPVVAVTPPSPPIKLQAIFFVPGHSSAMINGKTVHAGDTFKGFRVAAIDRTSATLISATQTNVMTLEEQ